MTHYYKYCLYCGVALSKDGACPTCLTSWAHQPGILSAPATAGQAAQLNYLLGSLVGVQTAILRELQRFAKAQGTRAPATGDQDSSTQDTGQPSEHSADRTTKAHSPRSEGKDK